MTVQIGVLCVVTKATGRFSKWLATWLCMFLENHAVVLCWEMWVLVGVVLSNLWTECAAQACCWNQSWTTNWRREVVNWRWQARPPTPSWNSTSRGQWRRTPFPWSTFVGFVVRRANQGMSVQITLRSGSSNRISTILLGIILNPGKLWLLLY